MRPKPPATLLTPDTLTTSTPVALSSSSSKLMTLRWYGSASGVFAVESALAIFSAMTLRRWLCALIPAKATSKDLSSSIFHLHRLSARPAAEHGFHHRDILLVERRHQREIGGVGRNLHHLRFERDAVAVDAAIVGCGDNRRDGILRGRDDVPGLCRREPQGPLSLADDRAEGELFEVFR